MPHEPVVAMVQQIDEFGIGEKAQISRAGHRAGILPSVGHLENTSVAAVVGLSLPSVALVAIVPIDDHDMAIRAVLQRYKL